MSLGESALELTLAGQEAKGKYIETIFASCASKKTMTYRELMSFPSISHFARAETILNKNLLNYVLGYCRYSYRDTLPILQFMIIDAEEVIFGFYQPTTEMQAQKPIQLAVRHPDIVALFQDYYNTIWKTSKPVRDIDALQKIRQEAA